MNMIGTRLRRPGAVVCLGMVILASQPLFAGRAEETDIRRDATVAAIEKVMPSVVNIATKKIVQVRDPFEQLFQQFWGPYYRRQPPNATYSLGSGIIIDEAGYLLTNDHVVRRADVIQVKLVNGTNIYDATVVADDPKSDVALLKINAPPGTKFHTIKFAREDDLLLGETVLALGNPFGLGGSVTRGILSSKSRAMPKEGASLNIPNWLQTDAPINPGNSGGPLVDLRGELIGINVAVVNEVGGEPAQGLGFAIPIRLVEESLSSIIPTEFVKSYWFGARVRVGTCPLVVTAVQPESPAGRAGLKPGDVILQVNGQTPKSFIDFADLLATNTDADVMLAVQRGAEQAKLAVRLVPTTTVFNEDMIREKLGLSLKPLTSQQMAERYNPNSAGGFVITGVEKDSPASAAGLQSGMLVTAVDGEQPPASVAELSKLVYAKKPGEPVKLDIAAWQQNGNWNVLRQATVELTPR